MNRAVQDFVVCDPEKIKPYREGAMAAATDKPQTACPYDFDTATGRQWLEGFRDGGGTHNKPITPLQERK